MIYDASMEKFERKLRKAFPKLKPFSLTQAKRETGTKHIQLKKWLLELVHRRKLRTMDWPLYFFDNPPDKSMRESLTALKKVNSSAISEDEELKWKMMNMERDLHNWKMIVQDLEKILDYTRSKK